ncbi:MAG: hemerythrin family protein [Magnetococcales bacterium]|nr:hemerythrin family protein [Magnetococcales bacterium]
MSSLSLGLADDKEQVMPTEMQIRSQLRHVGVSRLHRDHEGLVALIITFHSTVGDLFNRSPTAKDWSRIDSVLEDLSDYTFRHFQYEEQLMAKHGYPHLAEHREQHRQLVSQLEGFQDKMRRRDAKFSVDIDFFLLDWLFTHINRYDMKYKDFFEQKGVS